MAGRFIKLYEQITKWGWYQNGNTFRLFIHLLLKANYEDSTFEGMTIHRGQVVTSVNKLSVQLKLSVREIRTALSHLISTNEVTTLSLSRFTVITIVKYDDFQKATSLSTNDRQASDKRPTNDRQHNRNNIEREKEIETIEEGVERTSPPSPPGTGFIPPSKEEILDYCLDNHYGIDVDRFHANYSSKGWKVNGQQIVDWKALVKRWAAEDARKVSIPAAPAQAPARKVVAQQYDQRDYGQEDDDAMKRILEAMRNE